MSDKSKNWYDLRNASWFCVFINSVSALALIGILNRGLQTNIDLSDRIQFIAHNQSIWAFGWFTCTMASLATFYFFFCLNNAHQTEDGKIYGLLKLALLLATAGIALDLSAQIIEMIVLPDLANRILISTASEYTSAVGQFLAMDRVAIGLTGYAANGFYTIATLLTCWSTRNFYPKIITITALAVGITGLVLSYFSLINYTNGLFWSNAILMPCLLLWQSGIATVSGNRGAQSKNHL